jgi:hypothetical protein
MIIPIPLGTRLDASEFVIRHDGRRLGTAKVSIRGRRVFGIEGHEPETNNELRFDVQFDDPRDERQFAVGPVVQNGRVCGVRTHMVKVEHDRANEVHSRFDAGAKVEKPVELRQILDALKASAGLRAGVREYLAKHKDDDDELPLDERVDAGQDEETKARAAMIKRGQEAYKTPLRAG